MTSTQKTGIAVAFYLFAALLAVRVVIPAPSQTFPYPHDFIEPKIKWEQVIRSDQKFVAAVITQQARSWATQPQQLLDGGQCFPFPNAVTLGEHMLGDGLLGVIPYQLSHDPVLTYNAVVVLTFWVAAIAMYALVYAWTKSAGAAFIAGLLFGLHPARILNLIHPYILGNHWTPLALLAAHRLFTRRLWRDVVTLCLFVTLQMLESLYALLAFALIGMTYGGYLLIRYRRRLASMVPQLLTIATVVLIAGWVVFGSYLETRQMLAGLLTGRSALFNKIDDFAFGHAAYPGTVLLVLATIGLTDRMARRRDIQGYDARLVVLAAGLLCFWAAVDGIPIPGLHVTVPSLFSMAAHMMPGLDAVRLPGYLRSGVYLVGAFLAGYGTLRLLEHRSPVGRTLLVGALTICAWVEIFYPPVTTSSFGASTDMDASYVRPSPATLELYDGIGDGA